MNLLKLRRNDPDGAIEFAKARIEKKELTTSEIRILLRLQDDSEEFASRLASLLDALEYEPEE